MGSDKKRHILVVDDEPDITWTFKKALEEAGFEVDTFNDPADALSQFEAGKYDLLLLDIKLPKMSGFDFYREIVKKDSTPKVCFITAFEMYYDEFRRVLPSLDVKCFISKPVSSRDLVAQVKAELSS